MIVRVGTVFGFVTNMYQETLYRYALYSDMLMTFINVDIGSVLRNAVLKLDYTLHALERFCSQ
jgi:hypothetical protein